MLYDTPAVLDGMDFFYTKRNFREMSRYVRGWMRQLAKGKDKSKERVLWTMAEQFDGTGLVFNPETNTAMSLNKTGVFLWKELEKGADEPALVRGLLDHFSGVTEEQGTRDVKAFVEELRSRSLLSEA